MTFSFIKNHDICPRYNLYRFKGAKKTIDNVVNNLGNLKMENNEYKLRSLKETNAYIQEKFSEAKQFIAQDSAIELKSLTE